MDRGTIGKRAISTAQVDEKRDLLFRPVTQRQKIAGITQLVGA